jgi:hypothetical protein
VIVADDFNRAGSAAAVAAFELRCVAALDQPCTTRGCERTVTMHDGVYVDNAMLQNTPISTDAGPRAALEPGTLAALRLGVASLAARRRRKSAHQGS